MELSGGGHLSGKVERKDDFIVVQIDDSIQIAIPASRVKRIVNTDQLAAYRELAAKVGDDAEISASSPTFAASSRYAANWSVLTIRFTRLAGIAI